MARRLRPAVYWSCGPLIAAAQAPAWSDRTWKVKEYQRDGSRIDVRRSSLTHPLKRLERTIDDALPKLQPSNGFLMPLGKALSAAWADALSLLRSSMPNWAVLKGAPLLGRPAHDPATSATRPATLQLLRSDGANGEESPQDAAEDVYEARKVSIYAFGTHATSPVARPKVYGPRYRTDLEKHPLQINEFACCCRFCMASFLPTPVCS
jgi:hypothetical protein